MRWLQTEYILKGIYLGLLLLVALQAPDWRAVATVALTTLGGLAVALAIAGYRKVRQGYVVRGRLPAFVLFLLLESPTLVYAGILIGMAFGAFYALPPLGEQENGTLATYIGGGALLGVFFGLLRQVQHRTARLGLAMTLGVVVVTGVLYALMPDLFGPLAEYAPQLRLTRPTTEQGWTILGVQLLLGIPVFYLLTFAGHEEETEIEIAAMCAALGLGAGILTREQRNLQALSFIIPMMLYFWYSTRVLPSLRIFKHSVRGFSFAQVGRYRQALQSFRRALQLDPKNSLAREGLWSVHRAMDLTQLANDPQTLAMVDLDLCLDRAGTLLLQPGPTAEKLQEAERLLELVIAQRPALRAKVEYWRTVSCTHQRRYDDAAALLGHLLDPEAWAPNDAHRREVLLPAWQLALTLHEELRRRVGLPQLALPGRRMEAIAAVERHLADNADDAAVWNMKRQLYQDVTEEHYAAAAGPDGSAPGFDHEYVQQLGLALINDPARWQRGTEYLRLAARGLPALGPGLYIQIAQACERAGDREAAVHNYDLAKRAGLAAGPKSLAEEDRHAFYAVVKLLGEAAQARGDLDAAVANYQLYSDYERSGLETLRTLADLHERRGDPLSAVRATEQALIYNGKDKDLLDRKDRYYYSVMPDDLRARVETAKHGFDIAYCLKKARSLLDVRDADVELIDWAHHLAELVSIVQPESVAARVLLARAKLRRGERAECVALLEQLQQNKPEKFPSGDDEDAWFVSCRLLGDLYLNELARPDLAVPCFQNFRKSAKSGADTMYKLGQAYEQLGDRARATKCYEHVTTYDNHPLAPDARDALYRLQAN